MGFFDQHLDQYYADTLLDFSDGGKGAIPGAYGVVAGELFSPTLTNRVPVQPTDVLLLEKYVSVFPFYFGPIYEDDALLLPQDSSVTVGFSDARIVNGVGDDFTIEGLPLLQSSADVYVSSKLSSDPNDFVYLGKTGGSGYDSFDLSAIGFNSARSIKLVGLAGISTPEFSVTSIGALQAQLADGSLRLQGSDRADRLTGSIAADHLGGEGGNDKLFGEGGDDLLFGDRGNDILVGGTGDDALFGDRGDDILRGGAGSDGFYGDRGNNIIYSGGGRDRISLSIGRGTDTVRDFGDRQDTLFLPEGLEFKDLTLRQSGGNTVISYNSDTLVTLTGIRTNQITAADVISS